MQPNHKGTSALTRDQLAKLHIAKKALCLSEDDYRDLLERVTAHRSAREIEPEQLMALQRELRRLGWDGWLLRRDEVPPPPYLDCDNRPHRPNGAQLRMLEAMFKDIKGYADINPDAAFRAFLEKRFKISHAKLLDDETYQKALNAVRDMQQRHGTKSGPARKNKRGGGSCD